MKTKPPKGYLSYDLTEPLQVEQMKHALNAELYYDAIDSLYQEVFRPHFKYDVPIFEEKELSATERIILETIWEKINNHFQSRGIL